jgi:anti-sigma regulatory factor (Ser/Thr protein kinase)
VTETLLAWRFDAEAGQLAGMRAELRECLDSSGCQVEVRDAVILAADEACANIIRHAYGEVTGGSILLEVSRLGPELVLRLTDRAPPVPDSALQADAGEPLQPGGLGLPLIHAIMDSVVFRHGRDGVGNILEMRKRCW